jgi:hypothetical protein
MFAILVVETCGEVEIELCSVGTKAEAVNAA